MTRARPVAERFWEKVDRDGPVPSHRPDLGPCWLWTSAVKSGGYGVFYVDRTHRAVKAHRLAYELSVGPIPDGKQLDHLCRRRICVRPTHTEPVTGRENTARGTNPAGVVLREGRCQRDHPWVPENVVTRRDGGQQCRACLRLASRESSRRYRNRKKTAA